MPLITASLLVWAATGRGWAKIAGGGDNAAVCKDEAGHDPE
jgi:hypothetical protein